MPSEKRKQKLFLKVGSQTAANSSSADYKFVYTTTFISKIYSVSHCSQFNQQNYATHQFGKPLFFTSMLWELCHVYTVCVFPDELTSSCSRCPWQRGKRQYKPPRPSPRQKQPATLQTLALWEEPMWHAGLQTPVCRLSAEKPHWCDLWRACAGENRWEGDFTLNNYNHYQ